MFAPTLENADEALSITPEELRYSEVFKAFIYP